MKQLFYFTVLLTLLAGCGKTGYRYSKSNFKYKIIDGGGKDTLRHGDMLKVFFESRFEDSVLGSSRETGYQVFNYDSSMAKQPYNATEIFPMMKVGDSAVCIFSSDTVIAMQFGPKPPPGAVPDWLKPGKHFYMYVKILQKYTDTALFNADRQREFDKFKAFQQRMQDKMAAEQQKKDSIGFVSSKAEFEKFMSGKKDKMIKTASGTYVEILEPGTGAPCDSGKMASLRYRGTIMGTDQEFDSNLDTAKKPVLEPVLGMGGTITGFDEGIRKLRAGSRAKLYIPAEAAYGSQGRGEVLKPFSNLVFEIKVEKVSTPPKQQQPMMPPPQQEQGGQQPPQQHSPNDGHNH